MKKKVKAKTFAQRAKEIQKKFPRAKFDPIEQRDFNMAMGGLMKEQEAVRAKMGLHDGDQMDGLNISQYIDDRLNPSFRFGPALAAVGTQGGAGYTHRFGDESLVTAEGLNNLNFDNAPSLLANKGTKLKDLNTPAGRTISGVGVLDNSIGGEDSWFKKNLNPLIGGATTIGGNLLMAALSKSKTPRIPDPTYVEPRRLNLTDKATSLQQQAVVSKNIGARRARNLGLNAGQILAGQSAASSAVDRNLGQNLTDLYTAEQQYNVGTANQFAADYAKRKDYTNALNARMGYQGWQDQAGYLGSAIQTPQEVIRDIENRDLMERYYASIGDNYRGTDRFFGKGAFGHTVRPYGCGGKMKRR